MLPKIEELNTHKACEIHEIDIMTILKTENAKREPIFKFDYG
jgi:hypothetical protein